MYFVGVNSANEMTVVQTVDVNAYVMVVGPFTLKKGAYYYIDNFLDHLSSGDPLTPEEADRRATIQIGGI